MWDHLRRESAGFGRRYSGRFGVRCDGISKDVCDDGQHDSACEMSSQLWTADSHPRRAGGLRAAYATIVAPTSPVNSLARKAGIRMRSSCSRPAARGSSFATKLRLCENGVRAKGRQAAVTRTCWTFDGNPCSARSAGRPGLSRASTTRRQRTGVDWFSS